jgi:hypothetical protein
MSQHCGIVGNTYRNDEVLTAVRESEDEEDYVRELVRTWHYSEEQARQLDKRARSFMAVPFTGEHGVEAVLFIDSTKAHYFTRNRSKLVEDACTGISLFIGRTYV